MIRTASNDAELAQRMERSFAKGVVLLVVLVTAIGGTCVVKASEGLETRDERRSFATPS
jgi:hypothetical protein